MREETERRDFEVRRMERVLNTAEARRRNVDSSPVSIQHRCCGRGCWHRKYRCRDRDDDVARAVISLKISIIVTRIIICDEHTRQEIADPEVHQSRI